MSIFDPPAAALKGVQLWRPHVDRKTSKVTWWETMTYIGDEAGLNRLVNYQGWTAEDPGPRVFAIVR